MSTLRLWLRLIGIGGVIAWGCIQVALFFKREGRPGRQRRVREWSRQCMRVCGVKLSVYGAERFFASGGLFMVGNHVSWLDIFAVNSVHAVRFVAKEEVRSWPAVGWLAARAETVFIQRNNRRSSQQVRDILLQILAESDYTVVFPEGTSTDGTELKPFRSNLFEAAVQSGQDVWPIALYYPKADGSPNTDMAYFGDLSMWQSFCRILPQKQSEVALYFLEPIAVAGKTRQQICAEAEAQVAAKLAELQGKSVAELMAASGRQPAPAEAT